MFNKERLQNFKKYQIQKAANGTTITDNMLSVGSVTASNNLSTETPKVEDFTPQVPYKSESTEPTTSTSTAQNTLPEQADWVSGRRRGGTTTTSATSSATTSTTKKEGPRGYRNNNPLNIILSDINWDNKVARDQNTDGRFEQFASLKDGYTAAYKNLKSYIDKGTNTIKSIIAKWAPSSDGNNPESYAQFVAQKAGIGVDDNVDYNNKELMAKILAAMSIKENGNVGQDQYTAISEALGIQA